MLYCSLVTNVIANETLFYTVITFSQQQKSIFKYAFKKELTMQTQIRHPANLY